jgi:hypothetical protein
LRKKGIFSMKKALFFTVATLIATPVLAEGTYKDRSQTNTPSTTGTVQPPMRDGDMDAGNTRQPNRNQSGTAPSYQQGSGDQSGGPAKELNTGR